MMGFGCCLYPSYTGYHRRIVEWFGHYLQGAPAAAWMTKGVKHLEREEKLKRMKERKPAQKHNRWPAHRLGSNSGVPRDLSCPLCAVLQR